MAISQGENVSTSLEGMSYAFDKVFFQPEKPILSKELNDSQEFQEILTRKSTAHLPSGWLSYRPFYTSSELSNAFYTQDPTGAKPEVALVNGWPVYVTNTNTPLRHVNKIQFNDAELRSGSRVDGVFLEVWRSMITPQQSQNPDISVENSTIRPQSITRLDKLNGIYMYNEDIGWAVGENGVILKTTNSGINWSTIDTPVNTNFNKVKFYNNTLGYAIGNGGSIVKSIDGGDSWFELETPIGDDLHDLHIISEQSVCAVGCNGAVILSIDANTFNIVSQTSGNINTLNAVYFYDIAVGWAVGNKGTLLMTKDGGSTWQKYNILDSNTGTTFDGDLTSVAFYNLNDGIITGNGGVILRSADSGFSWANMSDRIWYGGAYKSLSEIYPTNINNLNRVFIRDEFNVKFTIAVYSDSRNYFKNLVYRISPSDYPNSLVLEYTGTQDNTNYINVLDLDQYATSEELRDAVNNLTSPYKMSDSNLTDDQREKIRVFEATIDYEAFQQPTDFRPSTGSFSSISPAIISFSVEDKAWIAGDNGVVLQTSNSGSKWEVLNLSTDRDINDAFFVSNTKGWFVGSEGAIISYNSNASTTIEEQTTDLTSKTKGRIFPEGNVLSESVDYLTDNIINPQVGVETTKRVQIQYRIRIVEGVDPFNHPESGLGHSYVYSMGPNESADGAGRYVFENQGEINGDYGLWKGRCRSTFDGFSWAIPMFFVTRKNSGSFSVDSNINGSTYFELQAIRPDGLTYEEIVEDDIVESRRQINVQSYTYFLQKNLDRLLSNTLKTSVSNNDHKGLQYGTSILTSDTYIGVNDINNLVRGGVSSSANIVEDTKRLDPNITITRAELTFGPRDNGLYHNDPAYYSAYVVRDGEVTSEPVDGSWEGLGTDTAIFNLDENFSPSGGELDGIEYQVVAHYINYSAAGLSRVPQQPISVKYLSNPVDPNETYYFNAISSREDSKTYETFTETISGYPDYVTIYSDKAILANADDKILYEIIGDIPEIETDYQRSLRKYKGQQFRCTFVEYHHYVHVETSTNILRVPKNLNGYSIFGVRKVVNINGAEYKISSEWGSDKSLRDREIINGSKVTSNIVIYLDEAFTIPANSIIEVYLDVMVTADVIGGAYSDIGITTKSKGENQEALRTSFTSNYRVASKSVRGLYTGVLYPTVVDSTTNVISIDLTSTAVTSLINSKILGIGSFTTKLKSNQMYLWYKSSEPEKDYYTAIPVNSVEGFGTSQITINLDNDRSVNAGSILVPMVCKFNTMPGINSASIAYAFYKYIPYQTVNSLPPKLKVEIVNISDDVYISNLGTGASEVIDGHPYEIPVEHIAVNDPKIFNDNIFSNIDDLDFSNFSIDTGFVKMPGMLSRYVGHDITLSVPNNVGDRLGRTFYTISDQDIVAQSENLILGTPRKVFVPMIGRIRTPMTSPFLRGELVLIIFSKVYKARLENKTGYFNDNDVEYTPGYVEYSETAVSIYRMINKPLVRK